MVYKRIAEFSFKATYYQSAELTKDVKDLYYVLHGYGQLPQYFIRKFKEVENKSRVFVAPGGLSRFYLEGFKGRVGSTWMTSEERLLDIENYITYLNEVHGQLSKELDANCRIHFLGFSQGAATVCRWIQSFDDSFERLIMWAGTFPHDMKTDLLRSKIVDKQIYMLRGDEDPFINDSRESEQREAIEKLGIDVKHIRFKGKHDIYTEPLKKLVEFY